MLRLFVNGKKSAVDTHFAQAYRLSEWDLILGADPNFPGNRFVNHFQGDIEEVRISRVARYASDYDPPPGLERDPDTTILYLFEEGIDRIIHDSSGGKRDARFESGSWVQRAP